MNWRIQCRKLWIKSWGKGSRLNLTQHTQSWNANTYASTGGFGLTGFLNGFALLLQLLREATRASSRHDQTRSAITVITGWQMMSNLKVHKQPFECINWKLSRERSSPAFSPVLAGFLLSSWFSTRRCSERSRVGLFQVFSIQQGVRVHQVLHGDMSESLWKDTSRNI